MLISEAEIHKHLDDYFDLFDLFCEYSSFINKYYIYQLFADPSNKIVLFSIDSNFSDIHNCPCGLIYNVNVVSDNDEGDGGEGGDGGEKVEICIMLLSTQYRYRKYGYASLLMKEFLEFIGKKYRTKYSNVVVILDSVLSAVTFYEHLGFQWINNEKYLEMFRSKNETGSWGEGKDDSTVVKYEHFIMKYEFA